MVTLAVAGPGTASAANFIATGHDLDYHCSGGDAAECEYLRIVVNEARGGSTLPILAIDNGSEVRTALLNAGYGEDEIQVTDPNEPSAFGAISFLDKSSHPLYSAIVIASDETCGGCDMNEEGESEVNSRAADFSTYFNHGGGLVALAGAARYETYYDFVPLKVSPTVVNPPFTVEPFGAGLGVTDEMANCCATHNSFAISPTEPPPPVKALESDGSGNSETIEVPGVIGEEELEEGLSRPWPTPGYGYQFENEGLPTYLAGSGLALGDALTRTGLTRTFADWSAAASGNGGELTTIRELGQASVGGVCFGLALSGGRFDAELEPLFSPPERSDPTWAAAGAGPTASMHLPGPSLYSSATYDKQLLSLVADDFVSQYSSEVNTSLQLQHYAYGDPSKGVAALRAQLERAMRTGTDAYDPSGRLDGPSGTGFALITLQTLDPRPGRAGRWVGHEVLAYSLEIRSNGDLAIDVWDNDYPGTPHTITVTPSGSWTYNAPNHTFFTGDYSLSGAPGYKLGLLGAMPLFDPAGLHFTPRGGGLGSGALVDVGAGVTMSALSDAGGEEVDVEPVTSDAGEGFDSAQVVDFPSGAGRLEIAGASPSLDLRGGDTRMTLKGAGEADLHVSADQQAGEIEAQGGPVSLTVTRGRKVLATSGVGGLTVKADGTVETAKDSSSMTVRDEFEHEGRLVVATLHEGEATPGEGSRFGPAEVAAAEAAAVAAAGRPLPGVSAGGGVLSATGSQPSSPLSAARIVSLLRRELGLRGRSSRLATVRKRGGTTVRITRLEAGVLTVKWYAQSARGRRHAAPVTIASGRVRLGDSGAGLLRIRLTVAGRALIKHAHGLAVAEHASFTPTGGAEVRTVLALRLAA